MSQQKYTLLSLQSERPRGPRCWLQVSIRFQMLCHVCKYTTKFMVSSMYMFYLCFTHFTVCDTIKCFWILFCVPRPHCNLSWREIASVWVEKDAGLCVCVKYVLHYQCTVCLNYNCCWDENKATSGAVHYAALIISDRFVLFAVSIDWSGTLRWFLDLCDEMQPSQPVDSLLAQCCFLHEDSGKCILSHAKITFNDALFCEAELHNKWLQLHSTA